MAYTARDFHKDLAIFSAGGLLGPTRTRKMLAYAGRKGIQLAGIGARAAAPLVPPAVQTATPYAIGAGLGYAALQTEPGQELLAQAAEHGRQSRILYERAQQEIMTTPQRLEAAVRSAPVSVPPITVPMIKKRAVSKFNRAVKEGMKIVKASTSYGKKGTINNPKKAFTAVTKTVSKANKGQKLSGRGIMNKVGRKAAEILRKRGVTKGRGKRGGALSRKKGKTWGF